MTISLVLLILVVVIALAFDFTNGFHDTGNAMATSIATGALKPKVAVTISALLNLIGAFLSIEVALTVTNAVIKIQNKDGTPRQDLILNNGYDLLLILLSGIIGAILWNLITWLIKIPSSSSHALFGGLIGSTIALFGFKNVNWTQQLEHGIGGVLGKIVLPAIFSPIIALGISSIVIIIIYKMTNKTNKSKRDKGFKIGQIITASLVSLAHGTNDAQKTMGIITLALIGYGVTTDTTSIPIWVKFACAIAIAAGTYFGGWRIIKTLGKGVVELSTPQGLAAELTSTIVIFVSSYMGAPLSTTHVASGSIIGVGLGAKGSKVNWKLTMKMFGTWMITLPSAIIIGYIIALIGSIGIILGPILIVSLLIISLIIIINLSKKDNINANNINDGWDVEIKPKRTAVALAEPHIAVIIGKPKKQISFISHRQKQLKKDK